MISNRARSAFQCLYILYFLSYSTLFSYAWILTNGENRVKISSIYCCFSSNAFVNLFNLCFNNYVYAAWLRFNY